MTRAKPTPARRGEPMPVERGERLFSAHGLAPDPRVLPSLRYADVYEMIAAMADLPRDQRAEQLAKHLAYTADAYRMAVENAADLADELRYTLGVARDAGLDLGKTLADKRLSMSEDA